MLPPEAIEQPLIYMYQSILVRLYDWYDCPNTILLSDYLSSSTVRLCDCATVDVDINESE